VRIGGRKDLRRAQKLFMGILLVGVDGDVAGDPDLQAVALVHGDRGLGVQEGREELLAGLGHAVVRLDAHEIGAAVGPVDAAAGLDLGGVPAREDAYEPRREEDPRRVAVHAVHEAEDPEPFEGLLLGLHREGRAVGKLEGIEGDGQAGSGLKLDRFGLAEDARARGDQELSGERVVVGSVHHDQDGGRGVVGDELVDQHGVQERAHLQEEGLRAVRGPGFGHLREGWVLALRPAGRRAP
jgi:hypothetical protein